MKSTPHRILRRIIPYAIILVVTVLLAWLYLFFQSKHLSKVSHPVSRSYSEVSPVKVEPNPLPFDTLSSERIHYSLISQGNYWLYKRDPASFYVQTDDSVMQEFQLPGDYRIKGAKDSLTFFLNGRNLVVRSDKGVKELTSSWISDALYLPESDRFLLLECDSASVIEGLRFRVYDRQSNAYIDSLDCALKADSYENNISRMLAYDGIFIQTSYGITFAFLHCSFVYLFTHDGQFVKAIHTRDKVPLPSIIRYEQFYLLERGKAFNSNMCAFLHEGQLHVLSYRVPSKQKGFIVDVYDVDTDKYSYSYTIPSTCGDNNQEIVDVINRGEMYIINSTNCYTTCVFK